MAGNRAGTSLTSWLTATVGSGLAGEVFFNSIGRPP